MIAELVAEPGPLWHERHQVKLASRPRKRAMGAGAKHRLVFLDRPLATLVHLRHATTHHVLARGFSVDRSTITRVVAEVRPLLAERACTVSPGMGLRTPAAAHHTHPCRDAGMRGCTGLRGCTTYPAGPAVCRPVAGQRVRLSGDASDPIGPSGLLHERVRGERFEKSSRVEINSVLFCSRGQSSPRRLSTEAGRPRSASPVERQGLPRFPNPTTACSAVPRNCRARGLEPAAP